MSIVSRLRLVALSFTLAAPLAPIAVAQTANGTFDGQWVIDVPSSPVIGQEVSDSVCPALRLPVRIESSQLVGALTRVPTITGGLVFESGTGPKAAAFTGDIAPDGTLHARWENFHADGRLSGDTGVITVQTECGPALATAVRVGR